MAGGVCLWCVCLWCVFVVCIGVGVCWYGLWCVLGVACIGVWCMIVECVGVCVLVWVLVSDDFFLSDRGCPCGVCVGVRWCVMVCV